jgi:RNase P/RNase MRP subunit p30
MDMVTLDSSHLRIRDDASHISIGLMERVHQYRRVTVTVDDINDAQSLSSASLHTKYFDILAVRPGNLKVLEHLCENADIDIISIDFSNRNCTAISKKMLDLSIKRGITYEICYSPIISCMLNAAVS